MAGLDAEPSKSGSDKCVRCGKSPAPESFDLCADENALRALCAECDVLLNYMVLSWVGDSEVESKIADYRKRKGVPLPSIPSPPKAFT